MADTYNADVTTAQGEAAYLAWKGEDAPKALSAASGGGLHRDVSVTTKPTPKPTRTPSPTVTPRATRTLKDADFTVPEPPRCFYLLDEADVLSKDAEQEIFFKSSIAFDDFGVQVVVVALRTTAGIDIKDYAYKLYNDWEIGTYKPSSGMLLLMAVEDDDYCVVVGPDGLQSYEVLSDLKQYEQHFDSGNYEEFALNVYRDQLESYIKDSDAWPKMRDYMSDSHLVDWDEYQKAERSFKSAYEKRVDIAKKEWLGSGADESALVAEGGGGFAAVMDLDRAQAQEEIAREKEKRAQEEKEKQREQIRQAFIIILFLVGAGALIIFEIRHGFPFLRFISSGSGSRDSDDDYYSSGGGGYSSGGGGGHSSGGGAGRGR